MVRASGQLIYDWDPKGGAVSYSNAEFALGYTDEEMSGGLAHWIELIHPEDRAKFEVEINRAISTRQSFTLEYRVRRSDGTYIDVVDRGYFVLAEGSGTHRVVGFVVDVSERRRLEDQLRQAQKMEAVGALAGGVAHDFNNLLTVIGGYSQLQMVRLKDGDPLRNDIEEIKKAADRAAVLTRQLLAFSRRQVLQPRVLDLNSIVTDMEKMLRRLIRADIAFVTSLDPALARVKADPGQIEQVLMNLVVNARDAMAQGGRLVIETANIVLDESYPRSHMGASNGPHVMLAVSDTGCGMDPETKARAFEPFFTTKPHGEGTGLGLATVYGIVKQSGGNIYLYSEPGAGTSIKIYLPQVQAAEELPGVDHAQAPPAPGTETILLVEDEDLVRTLAKRVLGYHGYVVLEAPDGEKALTVAQQHKGTIDLILTDVMMPRMSGFELVRSLAQLRPQIRVLYMSGYTDHGVIQRGELDPGVAYLQKPFAPDALARRVREILDAPENELAASQRLGGSEPSDAVRDLSVPGSARVLVLDDDKQVTLLLRSILEHNGYEVVAASTAEEALGSIRQYPPDVVITDVFMPGKDGLEFIKEARARHPELKFLAISGGSRFTPEPYLAAAKYAGAQRTLAKPFEAADLLRAVNELLAC